MTSVFLKMIKARAWELSLTALIIAALIAAMSAQTSLSGYSEKRIHEYAHKIGGNILIIPAETDIRQFFGMRGDQELMPGGFPEKLLESPVGKKIQAIRAELFGQTRINNQPVPLIGTRLIRSGKQNLSIQSDQALIGKMAAEKLQVSAGDFIKISGPGKERTLEVNRILDKAPDGLDTGVFVDLGAARKILGKPDGLGAMRVSGCWCDTDISGLAADIEKNLPGTRALTVKGVISAQKDMIDTVAQYSSLINILGGLFIALIVGLSIYSQTRGQLKNIALLLVVGARPWMIAGLFVCLAALIGLAGAILGWILGVAVTPGISELLLGETIPAAGTNLGWVVFSGVLLSAAAALWPALAASRCHPADIFRKV
ncbi:MAG: hypothetical protein K9K62_00065 [Desulfobacteraceae bacterium]|nr:hypothetical protein [Desulfobacteraceae bacterium]MCF8035240.1 hypothetical protein [Desulfobacteraceae bacterium]